MNCDVGMSRRYKGRSGTVQRFVIRMLFFLENARELHFIFIKGREFKLQNRIGLAGVTLVLHLKAEQPIGGRNWINSAY
jgi:hypothetical protein